jgi:hypothetical protein
MTTLCLSIIQRKDAKTLRLFRVKWKPEFVTQLSVWIGEEEEKESKKRTLWSLSLSQRALLGKL